MPDQIIIVDDDPIIGALSLELLRDAGYSTRLLTESLNAQDIIKAEKPTLIILDILMPGLDGMTLLHRLKSDPATETIKAIIVSGKAFEAEKQRAAQYGAEAFIAKPYDVDLFAQQVSEIMDAAGAAPKKTARLPSAPAPIARAELKATVWGCRSAGERSIFSPLEESGAETAAVTRYGKHTACVSVETPSHLFVFDAGSGLGLLGSELQKSGKHKEIWIFLTHFHPDHVEGLADFPCARDKDFALHISGASDSDKPFEVALKAAMAPGFGDEMPAAKMDLYELMEQTYEILPGVRLTAFYANHPGTTLAFILQTEGRKIVYCPDSELYGEEATALQDYDEKIGAFCRCADLMFHDGRYTPDDYARNRNNGHSSFLAAVDFAGKNLIKELVLVHQDGSYGDDVLDLMGKDAAARVTERGYKVKVVIGREGLRLTL